jgi:uncharacterized protein
MTALVASRYNILTRLRNGRTLAYNSLSGACAVWEASESESYARIGSGEQSAPTEDVSGLVYGGFVADASVDERALLRKHYEDTRHDPSKIVLTLAPTMVCNFGCDYCFQGAEKPKGTMSQEVQDAIISLVRTAGPRNRRVHVAWYGGEPLLAADIIERLSDRLLALCNERASSYDASIVTNGYLLSAELAGRLARKRVVLAQITLDGASLEHDRRRHRLGGGATFERILSNIVDIVNAEVMDISVRVNIDVRNREGIVELLDLLAGRGLARRKRFGVYFAPVEAITEGCHGIVDQCLSKSEYAELETRLTQYAYDVGLCGLPYPPRYRGICGAVRPNGFVVLPNGDVHKCWDTVASRAERVGDIFHVDAIPRDARAIRWAQWSPFENESCLECVLLPSCAGSCAHKFLNPEQTLGEAATLPCPSWKENVRERLVLTAERTGVILREDVLSSEGLRTEAEVTTEKPTSPARRFLPVV